MLHHIFSAALDLTSALQYVDDERAVARIRGAVDLLDEAARDIREHSLRCNSGVATETESGSTMFIADDES